MTNNDVIYDPQRRDLVFIRTETTTAWNIINVIPNTYSYTPELGMDLDIQGFNLRLDKDDIKSDSSVYSILRADISIKLAIFGLGVDEFLIEIEDDIIKIDIAISRIGEVTKDAI